MEYKCPNCESEISHIHPYYGAEEKEFDLHFIGQLWVWIPATILVAVWWPLGIAAFIATYFLIKWKAKEEKLYECKSCGKNFSQSELDAT